MYILCISLQICLVLLTKKPGVLGITHVGDVQPAEKARETKVIPT